MEGSMSSSSTMASLGDLTLTCKRCSVPFKYSVKDQAFYQSKGFAAPKFCTECRKLRKEESSKRAAGSNKGEGEAASSAGPILSVAGKRKAFEGDEEESAMKRSKPSNDGVSASKPTNAKETDQHKIEMRLKQVQYGYNTAAYDNYIGQVPKNQRSTQYDKHPRTPDPYMAQSKRSFDGRLRKWRRELHRWDPKEGALGESVTFKVAPKSQATASAAGQSAEETEAHVKVGGGGDAEMGNEALGEEDLGQFGDDSAFGKGTEGEVEGEEDEEDFL